MRAKRHAGRSSMDYVSVFAHGFRAISVFSDTVLMRMLVIFGITSLAAVGFALTAIVFRLFTDLAIPGWATTVVGISAVLFLQSITLLAVMIFTNLANRSTFRSFPRRAQEHLFARSRKSTLALMNVPEYANLEKVERNHWYYAANVTSSVTGSTVAVLWASATSSWITALEPGCLPVSGLGNAKFGFLTLTLNLRKSFVVRLAYVGPAKAARLRPPFGVNLLLVARSR